MKFAKVLSVTAAVAAASVLAASASAELVTVDAPEACLSSGTGMWMVKLYVPSEGIDFGIDCTQMGSVVVTFKAAEPEWFEGQTGGGVVVSSGPSLSVDHNWPGKNFWGVQDGDLATVDPNGPLFTEALGDLTYQLVCPIDDTNCVMADAYATDDAYVQVAFQEWGSDMSAIEVVSLDVLDKSGNTMISFDGTGAVTSSAGAVEDTTVADTTTDTTDNTDTTATTTTDGKGSPDTGVESVAAVAGLAVVAAGAVVLSKKRK
ncbi:MAG: NPXTG-anchored protein [Oscillospiraceae bacterium]